MQETKEKRYTWLYQFVCWLYRVIFYFFMGGRIIGDKLDMPYGGCVVMSNHINLLDCVTMAISVKRRELHFMGKAELFRTKLLGGILRNVHAFPVQRGQADLSSMRVSMQRLRTGAMLGIFPEGTRSKTDKMLPLQTGAAVLALKSDVPIIPMYITGKYRFWGRVRVAVGRPIGISDLRAAGADKESVDIFSQRMEQAFAALAVRANDKI